MYARAEPDGASTASTHPSPALSAATSVRRRAVRGREMRMRLTAGARENTLKGPTGLVRTRIGCIPRAGRHARTHLDAASAKLQRPGAVAGPATQESQLTLPRTDRPAGPPCRAGCRRPALVPWMRAAGRAV